MRGTGKKKCESCNTTLVEDEFDICERCMSKSTPFINDVDGEDDKITGDELGNEYFDDDYDY